MASRPHAAQMKGRQPIGGGDSWELRVRPSDIGSEDHEMPLHILEPLDRPPGHRARGRGAVSGEEAEQASRALRPASRSCFSTL